MSGRPAATVTVTLVTQAEFANAKNPVILNAKTESLSGVGDEAVYDLFGKLATLAVRKGSVPFFVKVYGPPLDELKAIEKKIALDVVQKL